MDELIYSQADFDRFMTAFEAKLDKLLAAQDTLQAANDEYKAAIERRQDARRAMFNG